MPSTDRPSTGRPTTDAPAPAPHDARRADRIPPVLLVTSIVVSLAVAILVAVWLVGPDDDTATVDVGDFVQSEVPTAVEGNVEEGQPVPPTTFELFGGGSATMADLAGGPVLVNFWASSCAPCLEEMPALDELHRELGDQVTVLGIDVGESEDAGRKMLERTGVSYRQGRDPQGKMIAAYGGIQLPHTVVIDADGTVVAVRNKALDADEIRALVEPVLGEPPSGS